MIILFIPVRAWKHRYTKEILAPTAEYMGKVRPVKYSDILEYDRKIREFPEYPEMKFDDNVPMSYNPRKLMWRRYKEIRKYSCFGAFC